MKYTQSTTTVTLIDVQHDENLDCQLVEENLHPNTLTQHKQKTLHVQFAKLKLQCWFCS